MSLANLSICDVPDPSALVDNSIPMAPANLPICDVPDDMVTEEMTREAHDNIDHKRLAALRVKYNVPALVGQKKQGFLLTYLSLIRKIEMVCLPTQAVVKRWRSI